MNLLSCLRSAAANISRLDLLYLSNNDEVNLWEKKKDGSPLCSSISPPPLSRCLVCLQEAVYAVCNNVTSDLTMEGGGATIPLTRSECPVFMETAEVSTSGGKTWQTLKNLNTNSSSGSLTGSQDHHLWFLLLLIPIIMCYWKRRVISAAWQQWKRRGTFSRCRPENPEEP